MRRVYLDHNATSPLRPEAAEAMAEALNIGANPSSIHAAGRRARAVVECARERVAATIGAPPEAVVFTSGGTEADNLAIFGAVAAGATRRMLVSAIDHDAVLAAAEASGAVVEHIPATSEGLVHVAWIEKRLGAWDEADGRPFVAVMLANNETGAIQPIADIAELTSAAGGLLLVDAVQALGKIDVDASALGANYLALSAHKLGGPLGVGALVLGQDAPLVRRAHGGGQERGRRAGTENVAGAAGFAAALAAADTSRSDFAELARVRDAMEAGLKAARPELRVFAETAPRLPNTSAFALPGFASETQVMALDLAGVEVSAGAACSSGKVRPSHVIKAMGADDQLATSSIRVSFGWSSEAEDADRLVSAWITAADRAVAKTEAA